MQDYREDGHGCRNAKPIEGLPVVRHDVAGVDLGSKEQWVCAPALKGEGREVASFGATTAELMRMAQWIQARGVKSVAMESTGVYWIAPHEVLEPQRLEVLLVDTRQLARVPGRNKKTDPTGCEWIQRLHSLRVSRRTWYSRSCLLTSAFALCLRVTLCQLRVVVRAPRIG